MPVRAYDPEYLRQAVDSLYAQTEPRWQLLVVVEVRDHDRLALELAQDLADPRVELVVNEGRKLAGAFNTGMRRSSGDFAAILLGDDMWTPTAVEVLDGYIRRHPEVDFFHSSRRFIDDDGSPISSVYRSVTLESVDEFLTWSPVKHLLCWRVAKGLAAGGMDESLNSLGPDDWDFPWTMAEHGARFMAIPECLYLYRDHRRHYRLSTHLPLSVQVSEMRRIMRKHGASRRQIRARLRHDRATCLRQSLYGSRLEQWLRRLTGSERRNAWRETYR